MGREGMGSGKRGRRREEERRMWRGNEGDGREWGKVENGEGGKWEGRSEKGGWGEEEMRENGEGSEEEENRQRIEREG